MNLTLREREQANAELDRLYGKKLLPLADRILAGEPERVRVQVGDRVRVICGMWPGTIGEIVEVGENGDSARVKRTIRGLQGHVTVWVWARFIEEA